MSSVPRGVVTPDADRREGPSRGYRRTMKLTRAVTTLGIAKKVYDEARKPQNQARIKSAVARVRSRGKSAGR